MSIRNAYSAMGVTEYYSNHARNYSNPHEPIIRHHVTHWMVGYSPDISILDLCCGSGEVTRQLQTLGYDNVIGNDPYTHELYRTNTGNPCWTMDFKHIATRGLPTKFDLVVCSFAMHLCDVSMLPSVLYQLAIQSTTLLVITPNKRPNIDQHFIMEGQLDFNRVKSRKHHSNYHK